MATKLIDRQYPLVALVELSKDTVGDANSVNVGVPVGALVTAVALQTVTAFDGTTPTATIGDGTTTFVNAVDISSTGAETVANAPKYYPTGGTINVAVATASSITAGLAFAAITYVIRNRGGEIQG